MSINDYEVLCKLGEGSYSTVLKVKRISDQKIYALKQVRLNKLKEKEKRNALNEIRLLASIKHPNVISYKEAFFDDESKCLCLVMEYAHDGDLFQRIQMYQKKGSYMSESFVWGIIIQLARGLKALHDLNIVHRDLKSANVFLNRDGQVKIGDMNVSKVAVGCLEHTQTGTPYYTSPEVWKDIPYDYRSDLWSMGCVIYETTCLKPPFRADDMKGLYRKVVKGEYPPLPKTFSQDLHQIVASLMVVNPAQRLNCSQILLHPAVIRHTNEISEQETESLLLKTINFPKSLNKITDHLPKPNFEDSIPNDNKSIVLPKMGNKSYIRRDSSEPPLRAYQERESSDASLYYLKKYQKMVLKENFGALRPPKSRLPFQKYSTSKSKAVEPPKEFTLVPRVKSEKISRKPSTNRSLIAPYQINE